MKKRTVMASLINGNGEKAIEKIPDNFYDWAIVDPPYGMDGNSHRKNHSRTKLALAKDYHNALWDQKVPQKQYFDHIQRVSKNQIIWGINYFVELYDLKVGPGRIFWDKVNLGSNFSDGEIASISSIKSTRLFRFMWNGMNQGKGIVDGHIMQGNKKLNEKRIHPTQKPVALYKWLLHTFTEPGDKIIDTHGGSMSIAIACEELGRELTLYEIDQTYYDLGLKRYLDYLKDLKEQKNQTSFDF